jgi:hypothetical protein
VASRVLPCNRGTSVRLLLQEVVYVHKLQQQLLRVQALQGLQRGTRGQRLWRLLEQYSQHSQHILPVGGGLQDAKMFVTVGHLASMKRFMHHPKGLATADRLPP